MIDPRGMDVITWCDATAEQLSSLGPIPKLLATDQWALWAMTILEIPQIAIYSPPDPRGFDDWFEWAMRFIQAVPL